MNDRELLELIAAQVGILTTNVDGLTTNVDSLTANVDSLTTNVDSLTANVDSLTTNVDSLTAKVDNVIKDVSELKEGQKRVENKLDDMETNNADRHITINGDIRKIKSSLSKVEIVAADNWGDIARLKANKRHRVR